MAIAYLFPGQGAQFAGMGQELYNEYPEAREIFDQASQVLGYDAAAVCFDDPDGVINATEYTQPLLLSASMAAYVCWAKEHPHLTPAFVAGLSLGEYTALVAAGSLSFADAVKVARLRGRFMQEAVPNGVGTMAAIIGLEAARVEEICAGVCSPENWVEPANYNCPGQLVVSGHVGAVRAVCQAAKDAGAAKALPLPVSAPFHSRLLLPAGERLAGVLAEIDVRDAAVPVVANVHGRPLRQRSEIKQALVEQVYSPVRFEQSLRFMVEHGVDTCIELGPGEAGARFAQKIAPHLRAFSAGDVSTVRTMA